jgi:hypothetical protein
MGRQAFVVIWIWGIAMPARAAHIALLIVDRSLCIPCIAVRTGADELAVAEYLAIMRTDLTVFREDNGKCQGCGTLGKVSSLTRLPL